MISLDALMERDGGVCWICGLAVSRRRASRDHVVPKSKGGRNASSNLRLAHRLCNLRRGDGGNSARAPRRGRRSRGPVSVERVSPEVARDFLACPGVVL